MEDMTNSYNNEVESENTPPSGARADIVSLTQEAILDRVDYETMLEEIRI
jgi:hypothetical protein